jgi:putative transposase
LPENFVTGLVALWGVRYKLSLRDLTEMFLQRGMIFSHEAMREWQRKLAPLLRGALRKRRYGMVGWSWYVDETYVGVQGQWQCLYRAIDRGGNPPMYGSATHRTSAQPRPSSPRRGP